MPESRTWINEYVGKIEEACGEGREFIITLKYGKREEALEKVLKKCSLWQSLSGIMTKVRYKDKDITIFRTGKLVIREFNGREEAESFLKDLLG